MTSESRAPTPGAQRLDPVTPVVTRSSCNSRCTWSSNARALSGLEPGAMTQQESVVSKVGVLCGVGGTARPLDAASRYAQSYSGDGGAAKV
jgi:hypothetical protein